MCGAGRLCKRTVHCASGLVCLAKSQRCVDTTAMSLGAFVTTVGLTVSGVSREAMHNTTWTILLRQAVADTGGVDVRWVTVVSMAWSSDRRRAAAMRDSSGFRATTSRPARLMQAGGLSVELQITSASESDAAALSSAVTYPSNGSGAGLVQAASRLLRHAVSVSEVSSRAIVDADTGAIESNGGGRGWDPPSDEPSSALIGGVTSGVFAVLCLVIGMVLYRRKLTRDRQQR